jgi:hypothetical protein
MTSTLTRDSIRSLTPAARRCRRRFLEFFPDGFRDEVYVETERDYKWRAHREWAAALDRASFATLLEAGAHQEIARRALRIESRTNLLFSFEKMAIRDAVQTAEGARIFAVGLNEWLYGAGRERDRFDRWLDAVEALPRRQTRVFTWPIVTVFGFIGRPQKHVILKPNTTRAGAEAYDFDLPYRSRPQWETYSALLAFARQVRKDQADLGPRDMIDAQSFIWTQGSPEYD